MCKLCASPRASHHSARFSALLSVLLFVLICHSTTFGQSVSLMSVTPGGETAQLGQPVTITGEVSPADGWGPIIIHDGQNYLGYATATSGAFTFTSSLLPTGKHVLRATGTYSGTDYSSGTSTLTVKSVASSGFAAATNYALAESPVALALADINGHNDIADLLIPMTSGGTGNVATLLGAAGGAFGAPVNLSVGADSYAIAVGDLNKDGNVDFVTASYTTDSVTVRLGDGAGGWSTATYPTGRVPCDVLIADFNNDGNLDVAALNEADNTVSILLGDGTGSLGAKVDWPNLTGSRPRAMHVIDFNQDGHPDLVIANRNTNQLTVLTGTHLGGFDAALPFAGGVDQVEVCDVDGDGIDDVVSVNSLAPGALYVSRGTGSSLVPVGSSYALPDFPLRLVAADVDGDGNTDIAIASSNTNNVRVLYGDGTGNFGSARDFPVGAGPRAVAAGDFNRDGTIDLAVINQGGNVSILLGQPAPDLTVTKSHVGDFHQGQIGAEYTITVTNVGGASTSDSVYVYEYLPQPEMLPTAWSGMGWTCHNWTYPLTCVRSDVLAAGASYPPITLVVEVHTPTSVLNRVDVYGGGQVNIYNDTAHDMTTITPAADLAIFMEHAPATFTVGQTDATFAFGVQNNGPSPTSGTVTVVNTLPAGLTATALSGTGWTCTLATLTCQRTDALAAGSMYPDITLTVTVASGARPSVTNTAAVTSSADFNPGNNTVSATVTVNAATGPEMFVQKHHSGNFHKGQTGAMYILDVYNNGGSNSSGTVTVADTFPAGLTFNHIGTLAAGWSCTNTANSFSCSTSNAVAPGAIDPPITVYVDVARDAAASLINRATISGGGDVDATNNESNDVTNIDGVPSTTTVTGSGTWGATVFTAVVTPVPPSGVTIAGTPSGTVTFAEGATALGTATLNASGQATLSTSTLSMGSHTITATYAGDTQFLGSSNSTTFDVPAALTTTTVTGAAATYPADAPITVSVSSPSPIPIPAGTVSLVVDGGPTLNWALDSAGTVTTALSGFGAGNHTVVATYAAQGNYAGSTFTYTQVISPAATTTTLASTPNPAAVGATVTLTATVAGAGATPTGTVTFRDGATSIGTGTVNVTGVATLTTTSLASGNHNLTAVYAGDTNHNSSTSNAVSQTIGQPQVTITGGSSSLSLTAGQSGSVSLTVGSNAPLSGPVTFVCSGLPAGATCAFSPASVGPTVPATTSVTIATTGFRIVGENRRSSFGIVFAMLLPGMLLLPAAFKRRRRLAIVLGLIAVAVLMIGLVGCGGNANHPQGITNGANSTPAGSYVVTVTGSSTGADPGTTTITLRVTQ